MCNYLHIVYFQGAVQYKQIVPKRFSSTIDAQVEFVQFQYRYILTSQVSTQFFVSDKIINNSANFRLNAYLAVK